MDPVYEVPSIIYLKSNESLEYFPDNQPHEFSNYLLRPLCIPSGGMEVGISEIFYTPKNQNYKVLPKPEDGLIICSRVPEVEKTLNLPRTESDFNDWVINSNIALTVDDFQVEINEDFTQPEVYIHIVNNNRDKTFVIPRNIAAILGFHETEFGPGQHAAVHPVSPTSFLNLPLDGELSFKLTSLPTPQTVTVNEPRVYSCESLVRSINEAFNSKNIPLQFRASFQGTSVSTTDPTGWRLKFSPKIKHIFSLPNDIEVKKGRNYSRFNFIQWDPRPYTLNVACDLVEPTSFGSKFVNFLRIFEQSEVYDKPRCEKFNPVQYHPVCKSFFQTIKITILDDFRNQYDFGDAPVTIALQFREKSGK